MDIFIENKKRKIDNVKKQYPNAVIVDVTSKATDEYQKFSPFFPIGNIPVPGMENDKALCVEGIWQGLKVFEKYNFDKEYFKKAEKKIKRTSLKFGKVKGHYYKGELLNYIEARKKIYLPAYRYVLENALSILIKKLKDINLKNDIVLLDYATNDNVLNFKKPLSHAAIIKAELLNNYHILFNTNIEEKNTKPKNQEFTQTKLF